MSNGAARRSSRVRLKEMESASRRVVRVAAALECVRTNYTLDRALQVLLPQMAEGGRMEVYAIADCLLLLPSGSADHAKQISRPSSPPYLRCMRDKQKNLMLLLCFALVTGMG